MTDHYRSLARVSLVGFGLPSLSYFLLTSSFSSPLTTHILSSSISAIVSSAFLLTNRRESFSVWWRAAFIGHVFSVGAVSLLSSSSIIPWNFGAYLVLLSFFHYSEYLATAWTNPTNLSTDSFLLNHSLAYHLAAAASWAEFSTEIYLWPQLKLHPLISLCGLCLCLFGELLRKLSMFHAGTSFNHIVQTSRKEDHVLVTRGVFSVFRHPSYLGWFCWSVGTQVLLLNPVCTAVYTAVSWRFFSERIYGEEYTLLRFFGREYEEYRRRVPTGLPFIYGYDEDAEESSDSE